MRAEWWPSLILSLKVAGIATGILIALAIPLGYLFARKSFPLKGFLEPMLSLPLVLPPTVLGYYLVVVLGRNGVIGKAVYDATGWTPMFSWWGAVIASTVVAFPLLFQSSRAAIGAVDVDLEQTAYTLGSSRISTFMKVTVPVASKGLIAGVGLAFARALGEFGATLMLAGNIPGRTNTVPLTIYSAFSSGDIAGANYLVGIYTLFSLGLLFYISKSTRMYGRD